ncbi:killer cell lectin-like receptor subfamily F member 1 [Gopherus flavomarginatus]|uniref:killer cell lectin-like receptor subfamily F member 1 n=1 Tax=Gopherus flavomarginatus TaxID=286002 RepID=UPI0021CBD1C5|nr:killer cell lectin-like receptor subfamily F member 1 [Gopherus flavomarginatus]
MEDDEGYTVLNLRPTKGNSASPSPDGSQEVPPSPRCYGIALAALGAWCIILTLAGIALGTWVFQGHEGCLGAAGNASLEELVSHLRQRLCESAPGSAADGSGCKVCPRDWLPHKDKCYWVSKESKFWSESFKDCEMRTSQMLVIQDREEMEFIQNITQGTNLVWIGLTIKSPEKKWTWVNTAPLDQSL